jgi:PAS domain S-box-containing protein
MKADFFSARGTRWGYVTAVAGTAVAALLRGYLGRWVGESLPPFLLFYPVVMASAVLGGGCAGLLATVLSMAAVDFFFLEPRMIFGVSNLADASTLLLYFVICGFISLGGGALRRAQRELQQRALDLSETVGLLELSTSLARDLDDRIIRWNAGCQRLYGFTRQQALGQVSHELLRTGFPQPPEQIREELLGTGRWEGELEHVTAEGRRIIVKSEWQLWHDRTGKRAAILENSTDITFHKELEKSLRRSEQRFRTLTEVTAQVVCVFNVRGEALEESASWRRFTGLSEEDYRGWSWLNAIHEGDRQRIAEEWRRSLESAEPLNTELRLRHETGVYRFMAARAVPVRNRAGAVREWVATLTDVTASKRAEAARNNLLAIVEGSQDAIISKNLEGVVTSWNRGAQRIYGYSAEEMVGRNLTVLLPKDRLREEPRSMEAIARGETLQHFETQRLTKEGKLIDVAVSYSPMYDASGALVGISKIARDITSRKRYEAQLRLQSAALQAAANGILITDKAGAIQWVNHGVTTLTGFAPEEMIGRNPRIFNSGQHEREFYRDLWKTILKGQIWQGEIINRRRDGSLYSEEMTITPVTDEQGRISNFVAIKQDITQRKHSEEALREASRELAQLNQDLEEKVRERTARLTKTIEELEDFSYSITHDMRAPLRAMRGYISLLAKEELPQQTKNFLGRIAEAAERMDHLIVDALDFSKALRNELPLAPVNADALLRAMLEFYPAFHSPHADILIEGQIPPVLANSAGLTQCFSRLLSNAVKFVDKDRIPKVRIRAEARGSQVRLWFEDNGKGIPKASQGRVFELFNRLDRQGDGAGLSLVRKVVERMGGKVGVESEEGQGSRFWVELALAPEMAVL